jgi:hypothetical protein
MAVGVLVPNREAASGMKSSQPPGTWLSQEKVACSSSEAVSTESSVREPQLEEESSSRGAVTLLCILQDLGQV